MDHEQVRFYTGSERIRLFIRCDVMHVRGMVIVTRVIYLRYGLQLLMHMQPFFFLFLWLSTVFSFGVRAICIRWRFQIEFVMRIELV